MKSILSETLYFSFDITNIVFSARRLKTNMAFDSKLIQSLKTNMRGFLVCGPGSIWKRGEAIKLLNLVGDKHCTQDKHKHCTQASTALALYTSTNTSTRTSTSTSKRQDKHKNCTHIDIYLLHTQTYSALSLWTNRERYSWRMRSDHK